MLFKIRELHNKNNAFRITTDNIEEIMKIFDSAHLKCQDIVYIRNVNFSR